MGRQHTLIEHVEMGQLIKNAGNAIRAILDYHNEHDMLNAKEVDRFIAQLNSPAMTKVKSRLDDELFRDHPYLTNDAFSIYYHDDEVVKASELEQKARTSNI